MLREATGLSKIAAAQKDADAARDKARYEEGRRAFAEQTIKKAKAKAKAEAAARTQEALREVREKLATRRARRGRA